MPTAVYTSANFPARETIVERFLGWLTQLSTVPEGGTDSGRDLAIYHSMYRGF
ncbi:hypothetical protein [Flaviflagellibacter deserti]|uniref:Uncharacterized protein n=1 Tax=Flaviflagellibacter deserti TaxID=2267266 RepID=A0ABV9Z3X6_9HYPH